VDTLAQRLKDKLLIREQTKISAPLLDRLHKLKLIKSA
jgi:hypothetical protein